MDATGISAEMNEVAKGSLKQNSFCCDCVQGVNWDPALRPREASIYCHGDMDASFDIHLYITPVKC